MTSIKPTGVPDWATETPTGIVEPLDSEKAHGWSNSQRPPASYMNWLQNLTGKWLRYLSYDWIVREDFAAANLGNSLLGVGASPVAYYLRAQGWDFHQQPSSMNMFEFTTYGPSHADAYRSMGELVFDTYNAMSLGINVALLYNSAVCERRIGDVGARDFLVEARVNLAQPAVFAGSPHWCTPFYVGCIKPVGVAPGITDPLEPHGGHAYFGVTSVNTTGIGGVGASSLHREPGHWWFYYGQSGAATGINLGLTTTPSAYQHLLCERRGATLYIEVNGQSHMVLSANSNFNLYGAHVGAITPYVGGTGVASGYQDARIDFVNFGVRR